MTEAQPCHRHVMVSGKVYRTVSHRCWSCRQRLDDMDQRGVARQVLSPMPELLSYWMEPDDGSAMCRYLNEVIASMVHQEPARFIGLGAVPLQDVTQAIQTLDELMHQQRLAGVEIGSNVNGVPIGDARFVPFFEAAAQWGAAVFVHALRPSGMDRLVGPPAFEQVVAFPGEVGLAAASMITGGTLARVPTLRIAFSHGGGSLQALLPRLRHAWHSLSALRDALPEDPLARARRMYYDDLVYDPGTLKRLIDVFGSSQILAGTDYPFTIMDDDPAGSIDAALSDPETRRALRGDNARRWLALEAA
jgi:aminocarboxymuconate-semialdehyde decarboxylase